MYAELESAIDCFKPRFIFLSRDPVLNVSFFRTDAGRAPVQQWLKNLDNTDRKAIGEDIRLVQFEGDSFEDFLAEEGILEEVTERALKRLLVLEIENMVSTASVSRTSSVEAMNTDLVQLNHYLFDLDNTVITSELLDDLALEATELTIDPVHLNGSLFDLEELLDRYFSEKVAA